MLVGADGTVLAEDHNREPRAGTRPDIRRSSSRAGRRPTWAAERARGGDGLHVRRALRDVRGGARVGRARADGLRDVRRAAAGWSAELGAGAPRVRRLAINEVVPGVAVEGPVAELAEQVRELQRRSPGAAAKSVRRRRGRAAGRPCMMRPMVRSILRRASWSCSSLAAPARADDADLDAPLRPGRTWAATTSSSRRRRCAHRSSTAT